MPLELGVAALVACGITAALCPLVIAAGVMDAPDSHRKVQATPTPTAGGLAIAAGTTLALVGLIFWPGGQWAMGLAAPDVKALSGATALCGALLALGLLDDLAPPRAWLKFAMIALLGLTFSALVARADAFAFGAGGVLKLGLVVGVMGSALWLFTIINATNFMDGANGLAMGCSAVTLICLGGVAFAVSAPVAAALSLSGAAALIGFLFWNFPRGALFAGDAGSLFAGGLIGAVGLILVQDGGVSPFIPVLAAFPVLADVLLTLAWRVGQRRSDLLSGHREHLYQIGLRAGMSHRRVSLIYWAATAHCGLIALVAVFAERIPDPQAFLPQAGDVSVEQAMFVLSTAWLAALTPLIALGVLAMVSLRVSDRVRTFAVSRGLSAPQ